MTIKLKNRESLNKTKAEELKKALTTDESGDPINFHWKNDEAQEFIDFIKDESNWLMNKFRVVPMSWPTKEIAKILDNGKFLRPGGSYKRSRGWSGSDGYKFGTDMVKLIAKKIEWLIYISDDELSDNIEGKNWEAHVKGMVAKKIANEIVEAAIYGRALENPNGDNGILNVFNGLKYLTEKNGNVIDGKDLTTREITRSTLIKGKKVLKTKYRNEVEVLMDSDLKTDLDELYNDPNGNKWDGETIKNTISGMKINEVPLMTSENAVIDETKTTTSTWLNTAGQKIINVTSASALSITTGDTIVVRSGEADEMAYTVNSVNTNAITVLENLLYDVPADSTVHKAILDGADVIETNPKNVVVGIQTDIEVEFERLAPDGWNVWYKMKKDIVVENPEATVLIKNLKSKVL